MTDGELQAKLAKVAMLGRESDCRVDIKLPPGASHESIAELESFIRAPLPRSLSNFLRRHDGFAITLRKSVPYDDVTHGDFFADIAKLEIYNTHDILRMTENFREYIDAPSAEIHDKTMRCFDIANVLGILDRIVFYIDAVRPNGEYAILHADLGCGEWLSDLNTLSSSVIADSFDIFMDRALRFMVDTRRGFSYWAQHSTIKLPRPDA